MGALEQQVERYSRETIQAFKDAGAMSDWVQVGNEITRGMLWPVGQLQIPGNNEYLPPAPYDSVVQWDHLTRLLRAGIRGVRAWGLGGDALVLRPSGGGARGLRHHRAELLSAVGPRHPPMGTIGRRSWKAARRSAPGKPTRSWATGRPCVLSLVERTTGYLLLCKLAARTSAEVNRRAKRLIRAQARPVHDHLRQRDRISWLCDD